MQSVYVDLLFLVNFSMDFLCFFISSKILYRKFRYFRICLASAMGGAYSVASLFISDLKMLFCITALIAMCFTGFYERGVGILTFITNVCVFLASSALLGGIMTAIFNFLNGMDIELTDTGQNQFPFWLVAIISSLSVISAKASGRYIKRQATRVSAQLTVTLNNKKHVFNAIYDSGNLLKDSFTGKPIIIIDKSHAKLFFHGLGEITLESTEKLSEDERALIRIIPCSTINKSGILIAFRPSKVEIKKGKSVVSADALIGFAELTSANGFDALLPTEFL